MLSDRDYVRNNGFRGSSHRGETSIIMPLIFANIAVFILQNLTMGQAETAEGLTKYVTLDWGSIKNFEFWRLGTYMFAHGSFMHILFNMWGIWIFGRPLEFRIGPHRFLNLYLISGLVGGLVWLAFNNSTIKFETDWGIVDTGMYPRVLGASGALFGVMVAAAMVAPNLRYMLLIPPIPVRLKTLVAVYAAIEIFAVRSGQRSGGVAHLAHLGGLIGGYFYMVFNVPGSGSGISRGIQKTWSRLRSWFRRRSFNASSTRQQDSRRRHSGTNSDDPAETIDEILDKIGREGLSSLTPAERQKLEEARNRLKQNRGR
jgi:membrane associated rhomboid family serine protease